MEETKIVEIVSDVYTQCGRKEDKNFSEKRTLTTFKKHMDRFLNSKKDIALVLVGEDGSPVNIIKMKNQKRLTMRVFPAEKE